MAQASSAKLVLYASVGPELRWYEASVTDATLEQRGSIRLPANVQYVWPHASRRFLYAATSDSASGMGPAGTNHHVTALRVDPASGKLTWLGSTPTEKQPRGFNIDPTGRFVVVSGEQSDMISSYVIDPATGALKLIGRYPTGKGSNWVEIVALD